MWNLVRRLRGGPNRLAAGDDRRNEENVAVKPRPRLRDALRSPWVWAIVLGLSLGSVNLQATVGPNKPTGLAFWATTYSGHDAIELWADDQGDGSACGTIIVYESGGILYQVYSCNYTCEVWKAAALDQGAVMVTSYGTWNSGAQAIMDQIAPDYTTYNSLGGSVQSNSCASGTIYCVHVDSNFQPVLGGEGVADGGEYVILNLGGQTGWKFRSYYTLTDTAGGIGANYSWEQIKWLYQNGYVSGVPGGCPFTGAQYYGWWAGLSTVPVSCGGGGGGGCASQGGDFDNDGCCDNVDCDFADATKCLNCPGPCQYQGGDSDGDGCCNYTDCDPSDPLKCSNCTPDPCGSNGGDSDGDGCCANQDPDDSNPNNNCNTPCYYAGDGDGDGCCTDVDCDDADPEKCSNCGCTGTCFWTWDPDQETYVPDENNTCGGGSGCGCCPPVEDGQYPDVRYPGTCQTGTCPNKCDDHGGDKDNDRCCADLDEDDNDPQEKDGCECGCRDFIDKYWDPTYRKMKRWAMFGDEGQSADCTIEMPISIPGGNNRTFSFNLCDLDSTAGISGLGNAQAFIRALLLVVLAWHSAMVVFWVLLNW